MDLIRFDPRGVRRDLARLGDDLGGVQDTTSQGFAEINRGLGEVARGLVEVGRGVAEVNRGLADVALILRERLPQP